MADSKQLYFYNHKNANELFFVSNKWLNCIWKQQALKSELKRNELHIVKYSTLYQHCNLQQVLTFW